MNMRPVAVYFLIHCLGRVLITGSIDVNSAVAVDNSILDAALTDNVTANGSGNVENVHVAVSGTVNSVAINDTAYTFLTDLDVTKSSDETCSSLDDVGQLTQTQLASRLTAACRYDRLERPFVVENGSVVESPLDVYVRVYIYVLQNLDTSVLQFKMYGLVQLRYMDPRLAFDKYAPNRTRSIVGEATLRERIWVPHISLANEQDSSVLGTIEKDLLTSISPDGTVIISSRIQATLYCWMQLQKFPFDEQYCPTTLESWMYNASELRLYWEESAPVTFDPKIHLTEYAILNTWTNETIVNSDLDVLRRSACASNYSSVVFTVHLEREVGYYVMDYFLPSIMIVATSWVSFWLQADQTPARTALGCTTLLSFITLTSSQDNNLPKVSYIKFSEVWFLGCTIFIFSSLVEFAFANTIWRRDHSVQVKKVKSKYILKKTITPRMGRHKMVDSNQEQSRPNYDRFLSVDAPSVIVTMDDDSSNKFTSSESIATTTSCPEENNNDIDKKQNEHNSWSTMTPHEVSLWIDRKARFLFPIAFIIFNAFFWTFVYCL